MMMKVICMWIKERFVNLGDFVYEIYPKILKSMKLKKCIKKC